MLKWFKQLFLLSIVSLAGYGQGRVQYNLNIYNGLPSNHVYYAITDTYGYLWLATTEGVVRYNGHSIKTYNLSDGLPSNDVWYLFQDQKKRIWLSSIAGEMGYLFNNEYKKVYARDTDARFYSSNIINTPSGIAFSNLSRKSHTNGEIYYELNDTLFNFNLSNHPNGNYFLNSDGKIFMVDSDQYYALKFNNSGFDANRICDSILSGKKNSSIRDYLYRNYIIFYTTSALSGPYYYAKEIVAVDTRNCALKKLTFPKIGQEHLSVVFPCGENLGVITDKGVYVYDTTLSLILFEKCVDLIADKKTSASIISYLKNPFWGECIATTTNGYYIGNRMSNIFKKAHYNLSGYSYCGRSSTGICYWWSKEEKKWP